MAEWMHREIKGDTVESVSFYPMKDGFEGMILEVVFRRPGQSWNVAILKLRVKADGIVMALAQSHAKEGERNDEA